MVRVDEKTLLVNAAEGGGKEVRNEEVEALAKQIEAHADAQKAQLAELDSGHRRGRKSDRRRPARPLPPDRQAAKRRRARRDRRRSLLWLLRLRDIHQMLNELINGHVLQFCMTCGRILYLADDEQPTTQRS